MGIFFWKKAKMIMATLIQEEHMTIHLFPFLQSKYLE